MGHPGMCADGERVKAGAHFPAPTPVGLYFAKLRHYERLHPLIFTTAAIGRVRWPSFA